MSGCSTHVRVLPRRRRPAPPPPRYAITGANLATVGTEADWATVAVRVSVSSWLTSSPDHLVRLEEECRGNGEAQGLGGLEVDHQLEFRQHLRRQIARLGAPEDLIHIRGSGLPDAV